MPALLFTAVDLPFLPSDGGDGFRSPSTASRKNLLYEKLAHIVLISGPKKQLGMLSKAAEVPSLHVTQELKAMGIQQAWELRVWG